MPKNEKEEPLDKYIQYVSKLRGKPEEFEDWALDNNIKLPSKKKRTDKETYDYPE